MVICENIRCSILFHLLVGTSPTGGRREVTDRQCQPELVSRLLESHLPQARSRTVAPTAVGGDQQLRSFRIALRSHFLPPTPQRLRGEPRRVVVDPYTHPTFMVSQVVNPVGDRLAQRQSPQSRGREPPLVLREAAIPGPRS